jgi:hypothetical protein
VFDAHINNAQSNSVVDKGNRTYYIRYEARDGNQNTASITRNLMVIDDTVPVMHLGSIESATNIDVLSGGSGLRIKANSATTKAIFKAQDEATNNTCIDTKANGDEENQVEKGDYQTVPAYLVKPGEFVVTYQCHDISNNHAVTTLQRTVTIVDDTPPTIALIWGKANSDAEGTGSVQYVEQGFPYVELGANANDDSDCWNVATNADTPNCLNARIHIDSPFDKNPILTRTLGTYTVTYSIVDAAGNTATVTRTVTVRDTLRPVIKVEKSAHLAHLGNRVVNDGDRTKEKYTQFPLSTAQQNEASHDTGGNTRAVWQKSGLYGENPSFAATAYSTTEAHDVIKNTIATYRAQQPAP